MIRTGCLRPIKLPTRMAVKTANRMAAITGSRLLRLRRSGMGDDWAGLCIKDLLIGTAMMSSNNSQCRICHMAEMLRELFRHDQTES